MQEDIYTRNYKYDIEWGVYFQLYAISSSQKEHSVIASHPSPLALSRIMFMLIYHRLAVVSVPISEIVL